ncbi:NAD(P)/FAD-dependent oxidoreductase [Salipiger marinus]|uniref:NAD(P)/FAD-dependent oxidoreductase n=1 Tax=Salipiger marinus TaxID=555512 RepID=UPI002CD5BAD9|nr:NAD(P)/FAD-dependent oxidoreductase [Salipiger manganoxidans]MEB3417605.1 NAD(P)/FAD-dependent oxidoreductase [Salipiger manganoxidans]
MTHDLIVIGGSYAGMAAALQVLRARRRVLVIDAGLRRNRFARHAQGFLGQDGVPPEQIAAEARAQLMAYPGLTWLEGEAVALHGARDAFEVVLGQGQRVAGRRILFATGVRDALPAIEGLEDRWGRSVFHCPYCHGYELDGGAIGVLGSSPMSVHQAELLGDWGPVTFVPNGAVPLTEEIRATLSQRGVTLDETPVLRVEGEADLRLADGRLLSFAGLFVVTTVSSASPLPEQIGCEITQTAMGSILRTDGSKQTSIPGIYACGDVAHLPHSVSLAVGDGAMAGAQVHRSLVWPDM